MGAFVSGDLRGSRQYPHDRRSIPGRSREFSHTSFTCNCLYISPVLVAAVSAAAPSWPQEGLPAQQLLVTDEPPQKPKVFARKASILRLEQLALKLAVAERTKFRRTRSLEPESEFQNCSDYQGVRPMSKLWEKISTLGQNASPERGEAKEAIAQTGDKVMHRASGAHGVVTAVETIGDTLTLSVECANGRMLRGLDRKEFAFVGDEAYKAPPVQEVAAPVGQAAEPMPKIEGAISNESILEKLS